MFIADIGVNSGIFPGHQNRLLLSDQTAGLVDATAHLPAVSDYTGTATAGDIDHDGDNDILVLNAGGGTPISGSLTDPYFLINDGHGNFARQDNYLPTDIADRVGPGFGQCLLFDADRNGTQDLLLLNYPSPRILLNPGSGDFSHAAEIQLPISPFLVQDGYQDADDVDLNGDGTLDLVLTLDRTNASPPHYYFQFLINNDGTGHFTDESAARLRQTDDGHVWSTGVNIVDLNRDGFKDVIAQNQRVQPIMMNDGTGHFVALPKSFLDLGIWSIYPIDANGDGRLDFIKYNGPDAQSKVNMFTLYLQRDPGLTPTGTSGADGLLGDGSRETLSGLGGNDVIFGAGNNDVLVGGAGGDYLNGGAANDKLEGDAGNDILVGAGGKDTLFGGLGADRFKFNSVAESHVGASHDIVEDFHRLQHDKIDLSFIDGNRLSAGDQALSFIGAQVFATYAAAHPGSLGLVRFAGGLVQVDIDRNGTADFEVQIAGGVHVLAQDFLL